MTEKVIRIAIVAGTVMVAIIVFCTMFSNFSALMRGQTPPGAISHDNGS